MKKRKRITTTKRTVEFITRSARNPHNVRVMEQKENTAKVELERRFA